VIKYLSFLILIFFLSHCSLSPKNSFWSQKIKIEQDKETEKLFKTEKILKKEFNSDLKITLKSKLIKSNFTNNLTNNNGRVGYNGKLKSKTKFKFSKIDLFDESEPEIIFDKGSVIFFNNKGTVLRFNNSSKLEWKTNIYTKSEKKLKPILFFTKNNDILIVADTISKYYALDIKTGKLLWVKNNVAPFNSQLKIYKGNFFVIDFENTLRSYSIINGEEIWNVKTEKSFARSKKKLSLVILDKLIYFNNSLGDVSAVNMENGNLIWQTPTQSNLMAKDSFKLKTSDLIANNDTIIFSNNNNEFFSLDSNNGAINWKQDINSNLRSTIIDDLIFSITMKGLMVISEIESGNIIRITDIFSEYNKKKKSDIVPVGFIVGEYNAYVTTNNGRLIVLNISTGKTILVLKIDNEKISRPFVLGQNLFIIKDNAIIKLD
tara:strand:+ start:633 stop:1931 length:1299 start_codon:yes stop_codon:yes gene_type:complete